jgi:hypothetical protein
MYGNIEKVGNNTNKPLGVKGKCGLCSVAIEAKSGHDFQDREARRREVAESKYGEMKHTDGTLRDCEGCWGLKAWRCRLL